MRAPACIAGFLAGLVVSILVAPGPALAQSDGDSTAIRNTVSGQLDAFRRNDGAAAYSFAAPNIKQIFTTPDRFMAMVEGGYKPLAQSRSYTFGKLETKDGQFAQSVEVIGPDNDYWTAIYTLEKEPDGSWKITGCFVIKSEGGAA